MTHRLFVAVCVFWALATGPGHAQAVLPMLPFGQEAGFHAIGRVNASGFASKRMCTGTLIAPDLVLTAAHCLSRNDFGMLPIDTLRFVAGYDRGEHEGIGRVNRVVIHPAARAGNSYNSRHDLALLYLTEPLDGITPLPVGATGAGTAAIVGYHTKRPERLSAGFECPARQYKGFLLVDCPVRPGNSGGPVLRDTPEGWQVIGVISATNGRLALASPVDDWLRTAVGLNPAK